MKALYSQFRTAPKNIHIEVVACDFFISKLNPSDLTADQTPFPPARNDFDFMNCSLYI
jgi:hypothetical protein